MPEYIFFEVYNIHKLGVGVESLYTIGFGWLKLLIRVWTNQFSSSSPSVFPYLNMALEKTQTKGPNLKEMAPYVVWVLSELSQK